ncbi:hypothetical protein Aazo_5260 (plasmid) ['Nostoc azollae' 0708]|uniref:Uncharacterized protein n=1 Tax=Nostoc azollae (strain 0708) TaxID=551115 RepID=D7E5L3_NOSA0|nr:hypothetical protein Aazo_5260 ['Nostoc azollae' 0708]
MKIASSTSFATYSINAKSDFLAASCINACKYVASYEVRLKVSRKETKLFLT